MEARRYWIFSLFLLLLSTVSVSGLAGKSAAEITIREWVTENPPDIQSLSDRAYVLEFWATWCHSCVQNIPMLKNINDKYQDKGLTFIALSQDKSIEEVRRFVRDKGIDYNVAIDNGTSDWFGIRGYPTVVVVNHDGKVAWQGYPWSEEFAKAIDKAVSAAPTPLLAGIDLGPFRHLREPLWGGAGFAKAYRKIEARTNNQKQPEISVQARQILLIIDKRISRKISKADQLCRTDPVQAYKIYADIMAKYDGIKVVEPAKAAYFELKKRYGPKNPLLAASIVE
jgi:thiol-disulfide isomerase/thioredoxin